MYNEHFGFSESPFNVTPDSRFFFVNPCYEEAYATLGYGIDTRKGFIVVTGEPGTGKTTLLKRFTCGLDSKVHAACIFDPHLTFIQLLRVVHGELGLSGGKDRLAMMGQLYEHLVQQLEQGQVVCLMIDEAQSLSIEMLEELRLLSNLETDTEKLLQIVLVGQPEFEEKLDRPELVQLKQRVALRCRLLPLKAHEIGSYIDSRLKTVHYTRSDLFDAESIERITMYSKGIPRLINAICDNALLIAYSGNRRYVVATDIDEAAHELQIAPKTPALSTVSELKPAIARELPVFRPEPPKNTAVVPHNPMPQPEFEPNFTIRQPRASHARSIALLIFLLVTAGVIALLSAQPTRLAIPDLNAYFQKLTHFGEQHFPLQQRELKNEPQEVRNVMPTPTPEPPPAVEEPPIAQPLNGDYAYAPPVADEQPVPAPVSPPVPASVTPKEKSPPSSSEVPANKRMVFQRPSGVRIANDEEIAGRKLEVEIYKAIRDRAITGVQIVSVSDGTVYLDGRVATPRQKLAAVRAALSVPGVKSVRDRIAIDY